MFWLLTQAKTDEFVQNQNFRRMDVHLPNRRPIINTLAPLKCDTADNFVKDFTQILI